MKKNFKNKQSGFAATELALMLPVLVSLLFLLVQAANAMHIYSSMQEASREGARMVLLEGQTADITTLVKSLVTDIPADDLTTKITTDADETYVTVEVSYDYHPFTGGEDETDPLTGESTALTLRASTTMPLP